VNFRGGSKGLFVNYGEEMLRIVEMRFGEWSVMLMCLMSGACGNSWYLKERVRVETNNCENCLEKYVGSQVTGFRGWDSALRVRSLLMELCS
jgi:hypothetical protein